MSKYETNKQWTTYRILDTTVDNPDLADPLNLGESGTGKGLTLWADTSGYRVDWDEAGDGGKGSFEFGADQYGVDVKLFGASASALIHWDQSADRLTINNADIQLGDNDLIVFGDETGGDFRMTWDGSIMQMTMAVAGKYIYWGTEGSGISQVWTSDVTDCIMLWNQGIGQMQFRGAGAQKSSIKMYDACQLQIGSSADITFEWPAAGGLLVSQLTANSYIRWGADGAGINQHWYGDTSGADMIWFQTSDQLQLRTGASIKMYDSCEIQLGSSADITMTWDGSNLVVGQLNPNSTILWGADGAGIAQIWYGDTSGADMVWAQASDQLQLRTGASIKMYDSCEIQLGSSADITMTWDGSNLVVGQLTADSTILWGADGAGISQVWFGDTSGADMRWSQSLDQLQLRTGTSFLLYDDCQIRLGSSADITMEWDGDKLKVLQLNPNSYIVWGVDGAGIPQLWYGDTSGADMVWFQSTNALQLRAGTRLELSTTTTLILPVKAAGSAVAGDLWLDTTDNKLHFYNGAAEKTVQDA